MQVKDLIYYLQECDPEAEVRVPYGDKPGENDRVKTVLQARGYLGVILTATRADHEMPDNTVLYSE